MAQGNSVTEPAQQLAGFAAQTRYEDLPSEVIECAKMSILDTLAVTIAGSSQAGIGEVVNLVRGWGGAEGSTILLHGGYRLGDVSACPVPRTWVRRLE